LPELKLHWLLGEKISKSLTGLEAYEGLSGILIQQKKLFLPKQRQNRETVLKQLNTMRGRDPYRMMLHCESPLVG